MTAIAIPTLMAQGGAGAGLLKGPARRRNRKDRLREDDFTVFSERPSDGEDPYLCLYRGQTVAVLRRFLRTSMETGRLPSLLGREFFRAKMSWWRPATFEDAVIFVHDVERSLEKLERREQELIAKIVLQEHTQLETAHMLHSTLRTVARKYAAALDHLSEIFLAGEILTPFAVTTMEAENSCQEATADEFRASCCSEGENIV
jgi:DNA-directed RNA polymerase specialized sigma24 family protein